jgi:hypothetical protein
LQRPRCCRPARPRSRLAVPIRPESRPKAAPAVAIRTFPDYRTARGSSPLQF